MSNRETARVAAALLIGLGIGHATSGVANAFPENPYAHFDTFASIITTITKDYVEPISTETLINSAVQGMVGALDPHSAWIDADEFDQHRAAEPYIGIGIEVTRDLSQAVVVSTLHQKGPAARDGLLHGDIITAVGQTSIVELSDTEIAALLTGKRGEPVELSVLRNNTNIKIHTVRDIIDTSAVSSITTFKNIGYVKLSSFEDQAANDLQSAVNTLESKGATAGLVLDLRGNGGGLLDEAVSIVDLFIDAGLVVTTESRVEGSRQYHASPTTPFVSLPLVVLIDEGTASAAEVVAGALRDYNRALLIGTSTFGKRSVQTLYETPAHGALKLTIGRYYPPSGAKLSAENKIQPDVEVAKNESADNQLLAALSHFYPSVEH
jgi:carboxyl-terminal processing protease